MKLSTKQQNFTLMQAQLVIWAYSQGLGLTFGEAWRPDDMQLLYYYGFSIKEKENTIELIKTKIKSKTKINKHGNKLSVDFNLFKNGKYTSRKEDYRLIGEYWESLNGKWGGRFGVAKKDYAYKVGWDSNHFQY